MRKWTVVMALLASGIAVQAGNENPEPLMKDFLKSTKDAIKILGSIKNQKTADAAKPKLIELATRLAEIDKKRQILVKTSGPAVEAVQKKHEKQIKALDDEMFKEFLRLEKLPASWAALENTPFGPPILIRREEAGEQIQQLSEAVQTYKANYQDYPANLEILTKKLVGGSDPLLDDKALVDPWGHPYHYDVKGPRNKGAMPDLWSQGPLPGDAASIIGNWNGVETKKNLKK